MSEATVTPLAYGDEIVAGSVVTMTSLLPEHRTEQTAAFMAAIVSRDGSRRIVRGWKATLVNLDYFPAYATKPITTDLSQLHRWEGLLHAILHLPIDDARQKILLWTYITDHRGSRSSTFEEKHAVGHYVPYTGSFALNPPDKPTPVNHIPAVLAIRAELANIAHGWDLFWHSRYVFSNHLRQQVVSRLVDGLLAYGWSEVASMESTLGPATTSITSNWQTTVDLKTDLIRMATGPITGDPAMWSRALARNIDIEAFRLRLVKGEIPGVNTLTTPWSPTVHTLIKSPVPTGNVNEKSAAIAEWHESNLLNTENMVLGYHDDELQRTPEKTYGFEDDHVHNPLRR